MRAKMVFGSAALVMVLASTAAAAPSEQEESMQQQARSEQSAEARNRMKQDIDQTSEEMRKIFDDSARAYRTLLDDTGVPRNLLSKANCVAVVPNVKTKALVIGRQKGEGVMSCRTSEGKWSNPSFIQLTKASLGAQVGMETKDMVFFIVGDKAQQKFTDGDLTLGSDLSVRAGPVGAGVSPELKLDSGVYTYATEKKGAFAGLSLTGGSIKIDKELNAQYYKKQIDQQQILSMHDESMLQTNAQQFLKQLPNQEQQS